MAVTYRSVGVSPGADSTTCVIVKPAGLAVDDLMIAQVDVGNPAGDTAITSPEGWTEIRQDAYTNCIRSALFWKIAVQADVDATDFTFTCESASNRGAITAWTGHDPTPPINAHNGQSNAYGPTVIAPTITPSVADCEILLFCGIGDNMTLSNYAIADDNPASWSERYDINTTAGNDCALALGSATRPETTATGDGTATISLSRISIGQLVAIAPLSVSAPTVTTQAVDDIATTTATGNGTIADTGGENCSKRGICWNTTGNPTVADDKAEETDSFGTGVFDRPMTGLTPGEHYYVKAYAYNSGGYGYGGEVEFTAKNPITVTPSTLSLTITTYAPTVTAIGIEILRPNATGDETNIASQSPGIGEHWDKVCEVVADDAFTVVYHSGAAVYELDLYNLGNHSALGSINSVKAWIRVWDTQAFPLYETYARVAIKTHGVIHRGVQHTIPVDEGWVEYSEEWVDNPETENPWTWDEIDALQAGVDLKGIEWDASSKAPECTQVYVEIDYSPNITVTPSTLVLVLTIYAPSIIIGINVVPIKLALTLAFYAPAIEISDHIKVTPPTLVLVLTAYSPTVLAPRLITPSVLALVLTPYAPKAVIGTVATPATLALSLATFAPTVFTPRLVTPAALALALTAYIPNVNIGGIVTPLALALVLTAYVPTVTTTLLVIALKYILELHNGDGDLVSILHNAYGISFTEATNEAPLLGFSIPADDSKATDLTRANEVWLRNYKTGTVMKKFRLNFRRDTRT